MDDLFACQEQCAPENIVLVDNKSYEDPVLLQDQRILPNILECQNKLNVANLPNYFETIQMEIKPHMRKIVSDWMLEVCEAQQCQPDVFCLAVNYMDRFLSKVSIKKNQFQLLGCVCMFLASKVKEGAPLPAYNLAIYTDNSVQPQEILQWEIIVLQVLQYDLSAVTSYSILDVLLRTLTLDPSFNLDQVRNNSETLLALTVTEHQFCQKSPAIVAVACLGEALRGLNSKGLEDMLNKLQGTIGAEKDTIKDCMDQIALSKLSLSGASSQPGSNAPVHLPVPAPITQSAPKIIPQQPGLLYSQSTTPTDLKEISMAY